MELKDQEKQILLHSLGLEYLEFYEKPYRNGFYTSKNTTDYIFIESLIQKGLMEQSNRSWDGESFYFYVTDKGVEIAKKLTYDSYRKNHGC